MAKIERTYIVPLRKEIQKTSKYRRAKKAVIALREFLQKHMKSDDVKIGKFLNLKLWERGIRNPPHKVKVNATKEDDGVVFVELFDAPQDKKEEQDKKEKVTKKNKTELAKEETSKKESTEKGNKDAKPVEKIKVTKKSIEKKESKK